MSNPPDHDPSDLPDHEPATAELPVLNVGDHVVDREDRDPVLLVVATPLQRAASKQIGADGTTVADVNPEYPEADHVIEVIYARRTVADVGTTKRFAFPRSRLERVVAAHRGREGSA